MTKDKKDSKEKKQQDLEHVLIPKHELLSEEEKKELFEFHKIQMKDLPKILKTDPAIKHLSPKVNDVVKITRNSSTAGKSIFYRGVISE